MLHQLKKIGLEANTRTKYHPREESTGAQTKHSINRGVPRSTLPGISVVFLWVSRHPAELTTPMCQPIVCLCVC